MLISLAEFVKMDSELKQLKSHPDFTECPVKVTVILERDRDSVEISKFNLMSRD